MVFSLPRIGLQYNPFFDGTSDRFVKKYVVLQTNSTVVVELIERT